ncbi:hypothetical protein [Robertkochia aurantiaca]|uniref:hypothetical protein n=1 Tax=Robertkochia aurantiaca TaxID=2873700 RepID=UPI001CCE99EE|nr:hypothetical protein [Robertkochia sp. 3YJGBD-33]
MPQYESILHLPLLKKLSVGMLIVGFLIYLSGFLYFQIPLLPGIFVLPLLMGMAFEHYRRKTRWDMIFVYIFCGGFVGLIFSFIGNEEGLVEVLRRWPWTFVLVFALLSGMMSFYRNKDYLTEGITLLHSLAFLYLLLESGLFLSESSLVKVILFFWLVAAVFSVFHALTEFELGRRVRLFLSLWSSFVMLVFSGIYLYQMSQVNYEAQMGVVSLAESAVAFFLLGNASFQMAHNAFVLFGFLPWSTSGFNKAHRRSMKALAVYHQERYNTEQLPIRTGVLVTLTVCLFLLVNYSIRLLPPMVAIWLLFWSVPLVVRLIYNKMS